MAFIYLTPEDIYKVYPRDKFRLLLDADQSIAEAEEKAVIEDVKGYLRARYDVDKIFNIRLYADTTEFLTGDLVKWIEGTYNASNTYVINDRVEYENKIYKCNTAITVPEAWDSAKWDELAEDNKRYYCIADSTGNLPNDTDYFVLGDGRNLKLVSVVVDIFIYNLLSRLNNADISNIRKERFDGNDPKQTGGAIGWLEKVRKGYVQPDLPLVVANQTDQTGNKIIYGDAADVKDENFVF